MRGSPETREREETRVPIADIVGSDGGDGKVVESTRRGRERQSVCFNYFAR